MAIGLKGIEGGEQLYDALTAIYRVNIPDEKVIALVNVGDLHRVIAAEYRKNHEEGCLSAPVFYSLRRALTLSGVSKEAVKRNALMELVMPTEDRIFTWANVQGEVGCRLPRLRYERFIEDDINLMGIIGIVLVLGSMYAIKFTAWGYDWLAFGIFLFSAYAKLDSEDYVDSSMPLVPPCGFETVESTVKRIINWNYGDLVLQTGKWNERELFISLQNIISEISDLVPNQVGMETRLEEIPYYDE